MSKEGTSNPFHEELDATVVAKYHDAPELEVLSGASNNDEDSLADELSAGESLEMTLLDTQDVSAWLEENLFLQPRVEQVGVAEVEFKVKDEFAPIEEEHPQKAELSAFFNDFESDAPAPPPLHKKVETYEPYLTFKVPTSDGNAVLGLKQKWVDEIVHSGKRPLVGSSLIAVLALCGAVAYSVIQQEKDVVSIESQTLSLVQVAPISAEQEKAAREPSEERYCLAQGIRLGAAVENSALTSVATPGLQLLFADFAQRCKNYLFVPETYLKANLVARVEQSGQVPQSSVTPMVMASVIASTVDLQLREFKNESDELVPVNELIQSVRPKQVDLSRSTQITKNIQWRLVKLGFYKERLDGKGRIDGIYNGSTQAAVEAFYAKHTEFSDSLVEAEIFSAIDSVYAVAK